MRLLRTTDQGVQAMERQLALLSSKITAQENQNAGLVKKIEQVQANLDEVKKPLERANRVNAVRCSGTYCGC